MKKLFLHLGFLFILAGLSIVFVDKVSANIKEYYNDVDKSNKIVEEVNNDYSQFKDSSIKIKEGIVSVSKSFNFYLDDFSKNNKVIVEKVNGVEEEINGMLDNVNSLISNCEFEINNNRMRSQCNSFKTNFNNMMESYEEMIKVYNDVIDTYNDYSEKNGKEKVDSYESKVTQSIYEASASLK